ncbi:MAG: ATP-binding cassette domain-containing protein [Clostridium sp.]|nr:ATP-binding cassette domain-containing protein [Clostridium sp.]MCM1443925.1 ATP-binding cassette domain-containing protein [Candidatus Amulumruptor caecigallinarius]
MEKIKISDLTFGYDETLFENLNLEIKLGTVNTLVGPNKSGKTTLAKILAGIIKTDSVYFNGELIKNKELQKNVIYISNSTKIEKKDIKKLKKLEFSEYFNINDILQKKYFNKEDISTLLIIKSLLTNPKILIIDNILHLVNIKDDVLKYAKDNKITLINITNDMEESLLGDNIIILNNKKIILNSKATTVLKKEKKLNENKLTLPFMIDLSNKLKFYDLIKTDILDMNEMVDVLWK